MKNNRLIIWIIRKRLLSLHCQLETKLNIKPKQYGNKRRMAGVLQSSEGNAQENPGVRPTRRHKGRAYRQVS